MGSGFKDWSPGDVLTAADVDGYLMRQTVMTFADSSARDTALSGVLDEGMMAYLEDTNVTTYYDGSSWEDIRGLGGGSATSPGNFSSGDVLDAADLNALPAGIPGGNNVGWDTISANQGISTTPVTLLSVTFTAVANRYYQIDFSGYFYNASAALIYRARVNAGGSQVNLSDASVSGAGEVATISCTTLWAPTAGSKTVEVEALTLSGTGGVAAAASYGPWLIVKDVGPA